MGTMAPIRRTGQRMHRISLTAGRPPGGLLEVLEVLEVVCWPGGVRLAAGAPGGGVAGEGEAEDEQRSRCADSSLRLLERRPTAVPGGPFVELPGARPHRPSFQHRGQRALPPCLCLPRAWVPASSRIQLCYRTWHGPRHSLTDRPAGWRRRRCQPDVSAKVGEMAPTRRVGGMTNRPASALAPAKTPHPARREGINMHGFIKRAAVAPAYGPVASDVR
jgi:hypothetical protein